MRTEESTRSTAGLNWFKSSYSSGGACLEVATALSSGRTGEPTWLKSSHSDSEGANCVEVAAGAATVHVRDSKDTRQPPLTFTGAAWSAFLAGVH